MPSSTTSQSPRHGKELGPCSSSRPRIPNAYRSTGACRHPAGSTRLTPEPLAPGTGARKNCPSPVNLVLTSSQQQLHSLELSLSCLGFTILGGVDPKIASRKMSTTIPENAASAATATTTTLAKAEAQNFLASLLNKKLRVHTTDERMFWGDFKCTDPVHLDPATPSLASWPCH